MFTGIIEEKGKIKKVLSGQTSGSIEIGASKVLDGSKIGDSIAVNGVCLTVTDIRRGSFTADVMPETLRRTNLGKLPIGAEVNLERAMAAGGRFGGHIVSGHVDGVGEVVSLKNEGNAVWVTISADPQLLHYIVEKGSICIDGISLTVACVDDTVFKVSIIPHTGAETTLLNKRAGDRVNLENDIIAKYVEKLAQPYAGGGSASHSKAAAGSGTAASSLSNRPGTSNPVSAGGANDNAGGTSSGSGGISMEFLIEHGF